MQKSHIYGKRESPKKVSTWVTVLVDNTQTGDNAAFGRPFVVTKNERHVNDTHLDKQWPYQGHKHSSKDQNWQLPLSEPNEAVSNEFEYFPRCISHSNAAAV